MLTQLESLLCLELRLWGVEANSSADERDHLDCDHSVIVSVVPAPDLPHVNINTWQFFSCFLFAENVPSHLILEFKKNLQ